MIVEKTARIIPILLFAVGLMPSTATADSANHPENLICMPASSTNNALGNFTDAFARDLTSSTATPDPFSCVICQCTNGALVSYWGTDSCGGAPCGSEINQGVARVVPTVGLGAAQALPALSLLGTVVLFGGILIGGVWKARKSG